MIGTYSSEKLKAKMGKRKKTKVLREVSVSACMLLEINNITVHISSEKRKRVEGKGEKKD
jgi:hypothetical protein